MSTQPDHIKEAVHAAVVKIESAHLRWQSRLRPTTPLRIPSASSAMVPLLVAEIRAGRGPKLYVCTQAEAVDLALAMVAHHSRVPMEHLLEGDVRERDFPLITAAWRARCQASGVRCLTSPVVELNRSGRSHPRTRMRS